MIFEEVLESRPGISKNYFKARAEAVLSELSGVSFEHFEEPEARFFALLYAEGRFGYAIQRLDLAEDPAEEEKWMKDVDKWIVAISHAATGNLLLLTKAIQEEAEFFQRQSRSFAEAEGYARSLFGLSQALPTP